MVLPPHSEAALDITHEGWRDLSPDAEWLKAAVRAVLRLTAYQDAPIPDGLVDKIIEAGPSGNAYAAAKTILAALAPLREAELATLRADLASHLAECERLRNACAKSNDEIGQVLAKALGYHWFKDDQKNFPGATEENGVCIGDHVAESLADEAAKGLVARDKEIERLREALKAATDMIDNCADVPRNADSLPMMVLSAVRAALKEPTHG